MTLPVRSPSPEERAREVLWHIYGLVIVGATASEVRERVLQRIAREIREHAELEVRALAQRVMEGSPS